MADVTVDPPVPANGSARIAADRAYAGALRVQNAGKAPNKLPKIQRLAVSIDRRNTAWSGGQAGNARLWQVLHASKEPRVGGMHNRSRPGHTSIKLAAMEVKKVPDPEHIESMDDGSQ